MKVWLRARCCLPPSLARSDEPFLLLKKFTPSCLLPEDRDDDTRRAVLTSKQVDPRAVYPFTMALMGYATFRTTSLCVSIHTRTFTQVAEH